MLGGDVPSGCIKQNPPGGICPFFSARAHELVAVALQPTAADVHAKAEVERPELVLVHGLEGGLDLPRRLTKYLGQGLVICFWSCV